MCGFLRWQKLLKLVQDHAVYIVCNKHQPLHIAFCLSYVQRFGDCSHYNVFAGMPAIY